MALERAVKDWRVIDMRKSVSRKMGKAFAAGGWGRHGPYAVGTYRVAPGWYVKATAGTKGTTLGIKRSKGGRSFEYGKNFTTKQPYAKVSLKRQGRKRGKR